MNASGIGTQLLDNASTPLPSGNLSSTLSFQTFLQLPTSVDDPSVKAAAFVGMVVVYEPPLHPGERSWLLYPFQFVVNALFPVLLIAADEQKRFRPVQRYLASLPTWTPMYTRHSELRPERRSDFDATTAGSGKPRLHHPQHTFSLHWCDGAILISRMVQTRPDYTSSASNPRGLRHLKIRILSLPLLGRSLHSPNILTFLHNADAFFRRAGPTSNVQILESSVATSPGAPHGWKFVESRAPRSIKSVILEGNVGGKLLEDLKSFMFSKAWYRTKVIPHQKGVLFFGLPGTGKTSLAFALASELRLDLYVLKLNDLPGDKSFNDAVASAPSDCIILVEGIDYRFDDGYDRIDTYNSPRMDSSLGNRRLSLAGMLSFLDGTSVVEGRIVIATSNQKEMMHSALRRPGRIDFELRFDLANQDQLQRLFQQTLFPTEKEIGNMNAQARFDVEKKRVSVMENAELFSKVIPERKFSAASIQSYLVRYKDDPVGAVRDAKKWVEDQTDRYAQRSRSTPRDQHHLYPLPEQPRPLPQPYDDDYRPRPPPSIPPTRASPRFVDPPPVLIPPPRRRPSDVDSSDSGVSGRPENPQQAPPPSENHPYAEPIRYTLSDTNHLRRRDTGERTEKDEREYELQRRGGVRSSTDEGW